MYEIDLFGLHLSPWANTIVLAAVAVLAAYVVHRLVAAVLARVVRHSVLLRTVNAACRPPAAVVLPLIALQFLWQGTDDRMAGIDAVRHLNGVLLIAAVTWLGVRAVSGLADGIVALNPVDVVDNLSARRVQTQTRVLARMAMFAFMLVGLGLILMTFPGVRQVGASLLASAGVAGLVAGIAARPVIGNLIAGVQIAMAQPIRIDDVLIVENEWGRVEEITGTYVVLRIWDERRMIIPLQWFIETPFQNWTRSSAEIIGTVFVWCDYRMPLEPLRKAAQLACEAAIEWDKRLCLLQVVEAGEHSMQLRVLVTAADSSKAWDLRCKVREALVDFMQREYPQFLPINRVTLDEPSMGKSMADVLPAVPPAPLMPGPLPRTSGSPPV
ncbi:MAG: MscS Mechanosensitive ion channel [Rhizobacter sp.]|nr:MscS Mechanosensitive ion channel [Rhizobacter sp.]